MFNSQSSSSSSASSDAYIDLASSSQSSSANTSVSSSSNSNSSPSDSPVNTSSSSILSGEMNESTGALFYRINKQGGDMDMSEHHGQTITNNKFQHMKNIINTPISSSTNNSSLDETSPYRSASLSSTLTSSSSTFEFSSPRHFLSSVNKKLLFQAATVDFELHKPWKPSRELPDVAKKAEAPVVQRNHIVVVDQAPFSVYKSVKSQESTEKTNSNLKVVNSNRNHPYNNSIRPSNITNQLTSAPTTPDENTHQSAESTIVGGGCDDDMMVTCETFPVNKQPAIPKSTSTESQSTTRNSSSNAILAHLKSLGPNFKSIFVRPKNSKHIDSSLIMNKKSNVKDESNKSILNMLFSANGSKQTGIDGVSANSAIMKLLPSIEPKELKLNQSVDDLLKKFATENDVLSRTIKRINAEASSTRSMSPASTRSPSPVSFFQSGTTSHQRPDGTTPTRPAGHKSRISTSSMNKWTCMVCLSKHAFQVEICSVCGSCKSSMSPPQEISPNSSTSSSFNPNTTINFAKHYNQPQAVSTSSSISSYLLNDLGFKHKLKEGISSESPAKQQQQSDTSSFSASSDSHNVTRSRDPKSSTFLGSSVVNNPYIKKWTCLYCNYCNDSLKIVCLNCRQLKANQSQASTSKSTMRLLDETSSPKSSSGASLNHDHTDNEIRNGEANDRTPSKKSKDSEANQICSSCKSPLHESSSSSKPEPVKTAQQPSLASLFANTSANKWTCSTCLVKNDENKEVCVTCGTAKPQAKSTSSITITSNQPSSSSDNNSLGSLWANSSKDKWTCSTCLIKNENSKTACVSCMTPKPGATSSDSSSQSNTTTTPSIWGAAASKDKWTCPTCLIKNDDAKDACVSCMTSKPDAKSGSTQSSAPTLSQPSNPLSSLLVGDKDKWTCSTCLIKNAESASVCVSCATPKPGSKSTSGTNSLASLFGSSSGGGDKWTCSTCLVKNDSNKVKCDACQTDKPGGSTSKASLSSQPTLIFPSSSASLPPPNSSIKFGLSSNSVGTSSFMSTSSDSTSSNPIKFDSSVFSAKSSFSAGSSLTGTNSSNSNTASATPSFGSLFGSNKPTSSNGAVEFKTPFTFGSTTSDKTDSSAKPDTIAPTATSAALPAISFGGQTKLDFSKPATTEQPKDFFSTLGTSSTSSGSLFKLPTTPAIGSSTTATNPTGADTGVSSQPSTTTPSISFAATPFKLDSSAPLSLPASNQVKPFTSFFGSAGQNSTAGTSASENKLMTPFASFATPKETTPILSSQPATSSTTGSLFGATGLTSSNGTTTSASTQQPTITGTSTFFSFGSSSTGSTPSLFGNNASTSTLSKPASTQPTTSLFGATPPTTASSTTNTLQQSSTQPFGSQFSLFGANNPPAATTAPANTSSTSGFQFSFNKPATTTSQPTDSLFGQSLGGAPPNQTIQAPTATSSSLFSNTGTNSSSQFGLNFGSNPSTTALSTTTTAAPAQSSSFQFNLTPSMNFNFGSTAAPPGLNQNGIVQFSGNNETTTTTEGRKFRRAKRTFR